MNTFSRSVKLFGLSLFSLVLLSCIVFFSFSADSYKPVDVADDLPDGCTSIIAGKLATTDGSTITSHTCDSFGDRTWANIIPHMKHEPGAVNKIYSRRKYPAVATDIQPLIYKGEIPEVEETFSLFNTAYPAMNERQVAMGETTIGGRRELRSSKGIFQIEELQRVVFGRTTTARDAVRMMGELAEKYGYCDTGECLTVIDPNEAWHFEIFGPGKDRFGAVWAAVRIPDDHVGVSANRPRIGEININDSDNYMASDNVFSLAEEMGWWDPKSGEPFKMWEAYSGRKPFSIREFWVLSSLAPSLNLSYDAEELPFSVKPDTEISVKTVMELFKATYAGSKYDMLQNLKVKNRRTEEIETSPVVHPWMNSDMRNLLNELKPQHPAMSARIPILGGVTHLPADFDNGAQKNFRRDSAAWAFRRAERLAVEVWPQVKDTINETIAHFDERASIEVPVIEKRFVEIYKNDPEKAVEMLTNYTNDFCRAVTHKYWELGDEFWGLAARKW